MRFTDKLGINVPAYLSTSMLVANAESDAKGNSVVGATRPIRSSSARGPALLGRRKLTLFLTSSTRTSRGRSCANAP